ncbi:MAG: helix-turn-helix transcriptional regulator [Spirochaetaceae bacterium]|jgi:transcriptional regulator with XRE-family HTH domain|nr:helix-turn-helix transcriptional regulator [Spirochaetaceae bacterium]
MSEIRDRIQKSREALNVSQREFAKRIFVSKTLLSEIELGNRKVSDKTIQLISTEFNINKEWLITGKGEMFTAPPPDIQLQKLIDIFKQLDKPLRDCLLIQSKALLKIRKENTGNENEVD